MYEEKFSKPIKELKNLKFFIPAYQRGYRWDRRQVEDLLNDIWEFMKLEDKNEKAFYCLQPLVVRKDENKEHHRVIDGQQRLTTIYLILKALGESELYSIEYETREESKEFLENIEINEEMEKKSEENIDFYFMYHNYYFIKEWLEKKKSNCKSIDDLKNTLLKKVKFIWYELSEEEDEIQVFERLNIRKIPLTNSELIKAVLLHNLNSNDYDKQLKLVSEWDYIEKILQNDRFFAFIHKDKDFKSPTRIDFIFNIVAEDLKNSHQINIENLKEDDERWSFYIINEAIKLEIGKSEDKSSDIYIWDKVKQIFRIFEEFYNDNEYYHLVGYLVNAKDDKTNKAIKDILKEYKESNKLEFKNYLKREIRDTLSYKKNGKPKHIETVEEISELEYGENDTAINRLLFLYNVVLTMGNNQKDTNKNELYPFIYNRYPFDLHKKERWSLEHINPRNPEDLDKNEKKKILNELKKYICDKNLKKEIDKALNSKKDIDKVINKHIGDNINSIKNLALLSQEINSSLQNSFFFEKREKIINFDKKGKFIPIGTKRVFLKYYTKNPQEFYKWNKEDQREYLKHIKETLKDYIEVNKNGK